MSQLQISERKERKLLYGAIDELGCLDSMLNYYQLVFKTINHLVGHERFAKTEHLARLSVDEVRHIRRYVNADLDNLSIEFYLQRVNWALACRNDNPHQKAHQKSAQAKPAHHPCLMVGGFRQIVDGKEYSYEDFLTETIPIFLAVHSHLTSINRSLGNLYYYVTEAPFSSFSPTGKSEIRNLNRQLNRIMKGLLVATHLQPQTEAQNDLVNYLISCRADCHHLFESIPRYYQTHRMRLEIFDVDPPLFDPNKVWEPQSLPVTCLPWSAGIYLDFLTAYEDITFHVMAILSWAIRLYSIWYFVPRRYLRLISPTGTAQSLS